MGRAAHRPQPDLFGLATRPATDLMTRPAPPESAPPVASVPAAPQACPLMARRIEAYRRAGARIGWAVDGRLELVLDGGRTLSLPADRAALYGLP